MGRIIYQLADDSTLYYKDIIIKIFSAKVTILTPATETELVIMNSEYLHKYRQRHRYVTTYNLHAYVPTYTLTNTFFEWRKRNLLKMSSLKATSHISSY